VKFDAGFHKEVRKYKLSDTMPFYVCSGDIESKSRWSLNARIVIKITGYLQMHNTKHHLTHLYS